MRRSIYFLFTLFSLLAFLMQSFAFSGNTIKTNKIKSLKGGNFKTKNQRVPLKVGNNSARNGIYVQSYKVLDDRSLAQKLQVAEAGLANLRFFDQTTLSSAIGSLQGANLTSTSISGSVVAKPTASLDTVTTTNTAADNSITSSVVETEKNPSNAPQPPTITQPSSVFAAPSGFRLSAQDLLSEQLSLTYQVTNLRTLLERAVSDRRVNANYINSDGSTIQTSGTKTIVALGFDISVKNFNEYKDAVAEVQLEISNKGAKQTIAGKEIYTETYDQKPSLMMLLPKEKTYNVATITKDSKSFSLGASVQVLNVGVAAEKKTETLYLVRDNDTSSFGSDPLKSDAIEDCPAGSDKSLSFGWQFKPVLGRKSVEPGSRQVIALVALPNDERSEYIGTVRVKTQWYKYNKKSKTVGDPIGEAGYQCLEDLKISKVKDTEDALKPKLTIPPIWRNIGSGLAEVSLNGYNFLPPTNIMIGDTILNTSQPTMTQTGENDIRFVLPIQKLAMASDIYISSLYGGSQPIRQPLLENDAIKSEMGWGYKIDSITATTKDGQNATLAIKILPLVSGKSPTLNDDIHKSLLIIGDQVFDTNSLKIIDEAGTDAKIVTVSVPFQLAESAKKVTIKDIFWGPDYSSTFPIDLASVFTAKKLDVISSNANATRLAITGSNFADDTVVFVDGKEYSVSQNSSNFKRLTPSLIELKLDITPADLKNIKQIFVVKNNSIFVSLSTSSKPEELKAEITKAGLITEGETKEIKLEGTGLNNVSYVLFANERLLFTPSSDGKSGNLFVTRELGKTRGNQQLDFILKDGGKYQYLLKISAP